LLLLGNWYCSGVFEHHTGLDRFELQKSIVGVSDHSTETEKLGEKREEKYEFFVTNCSKSFFKDNPHKEFELFHMSHVSMFYFYIIYLEIIKKKILFSTI
jgi:hypothetical protein